MRDTNNFYVATYKEPTYAVDIIKNNKTEFLITLRRIKMFGK